MVVVVVVEDHHHVKGMGKRKRAKISPNIVTFKRPIRNEEVVGKGLVLLY